MELILCRLYFLYLDFPTKTILFVSKVFFKLLDFKLYMYWLQSFFVSM